MAVPLVIPCCEKSLCSDAPILNLSAELSDGPSFVGINFGGQNVPPIGDDFRDPSDPCFSVTSGSQLLADQSAQRCQVRHETDDPGGGGGDWHDPHGNPVTVYGNTPQSCLVTCPDGSPFTYTVAAGTYLSVNQIIADRIAHSFACILAQQNKVCFSALDTEACRNEAYSSTLSVQGTGPFTFTITSGSLPTGLTASTTPSTFTLSGIPTVPGNYTFQIRAVSANGNFMQKTFTISVLGFTNTLPLPSFTQGSAYNVQLAGAGGLSPYIFTVSSGTLPAGLTLSAGGLISGTPTGTTSANVTITVTDVLDQECDIAVTLNSTGVVINYAICNWAADVLPALTFAGCPASAFPAWGGVFDKSTLNNQGGTLLYFINQSISGQKVAANEAPDYPAGDWQNMDCFTQLNYDVGSGSWFLALECVDCNTVWVGELHNTDPTNPVGSYALIFGAGPNFIQVSKLNSTAGPDWSQLAWDAATLTTAGNGVASFTPSSALGASFDAKASSPDISNAAFHARAENNAFLSYTGPAKNCNLAVTWTNLPASVFGGSGFIQIEQIFGMTTFVLTNKTFNFGVTPTGAYNMPFTLINTTGACSKLHIRVFTDHVHQIGSPAVAGVAELAGTIANV